MEIKTCPVCDKPYEYALTVHYDKGKQWCEHDKLSVENHQSRMNIEASKMAIEMANRQKEIDRQSGESKMIPITSTQGGKNYGKTEMLPEKVVKELETKFAPIIENLPE